MSNEDSKDFLSTLDCENVKQDIDAYNLILPDTFSDMTASDHLNYWGFSFKAVMVTDTAYFRNGNYHTVNDTIETIDFEKMRYAVDMVVNSVINLDVGGGL